MATISPTRLLAELESLLVDCPKDLDPKLKAQLGATAKKVYLSFEKPEDVVARVLLSQVSSHRSINLIGS